MLQCQTVLQGTIEVRPNPGTSKSNRLSAHSLSLEELLRYTDDDTKETAFEVRSWQRAHACCSNYIRHSVA